MYTCNACLVCTEVIEVIQGREYIYIIYRYIHIHTYIHTYMCTHVHMYYVYLVLEALKYFIIINYMYVLHTCEAHVCMYVHKLDMYVVLYMWYTSNAIITFIYLFTVCILHVCTHHMYMVHFFVHVCKYFTQFYNSTFCNVRLLHTCVPCVCTILCIQHTYIVLVPYMYVYTTCTVLYNMYHIYALWYK